ncbi:MAG: hypothetical protein HUJ29_12585 [Gammaproteobacteria bacterium]|nr:hypothetical protein [Gammaproteobacteria bacterium]
MKRYKAIQLVLTALLGLQACGGGIVKEIPAKPDAGTKYIFYLHGSAEEISGASAKYQTTIESIASDSATVISEVRGDTDPNTYAEKLHAQVKVLLASGVPASSITISGFSKGAIIALAAAGVINRPDVNYVLLAGCAEDLNDKYNVAASQAVGRILSIYDLDDENFGSCEGVLKTSDRLVFEEIALESGKGHKLFRIPKDKFIQLWLAPLLDWAGA